jgi:hypothetical protein
MDEIRRIVAPGYALRAARFSNPSLRLIPTQTIASNTQSLAGFPLTCSQQPGLSALGTRSRSLKVDSIASPLNSSHPVAGPDQYTPQE